MACGVGILRAEGRSECINIAECLGIGLTVELTAYCQAGLFFEEILAVIHFSLRGSRKFFHIQSGDAEHFTGTFTVAACDQWGVHIDKTPLLEELMNGIRDHGAHTEHCLEGIGSRTQMGNGAQVFHGVALFLQRIVCSGIPFNSDLLCLDLKRLLCLGCCNQGTFYDNGSAYI